MTEYEQFIMLLNLMGVKFSVKENDAAEYNVVTIVGTDFHFRTKNGKFESVHSNGTHSGCGRIERAFDGTEVESSAAQPNVACIEIDNVTDLLNYIAANNWPNGIETVKPVNIVYATGPRLPAPVVDRNLRDGMVGNYPSSLLIVDTVVGVSTTLVVTDLAAWKAATLVAAGLKYSGQVSRMALARIAKAISLHIPIIVLAKDTP